MSDLREPQMCRQEFEELQAEAGYPFVSETQAREFLWRKTLRLEVESMLAGPNSSTRRVERE